MTNETGFPRPAVLLMHGLLQNSEIWCLTLSWCGGEVERRGGRKQSKDQYDEKKRVGCERRVDGSEDVCRQDRLILTLQGLLAGVAGIHAGRQRLRCLARQHPVGASPAYICLQELALTDRLLFFPPTLIAQIGNPFLFLFSSILFIFSLETFLTLPYSFLYFL